MEILYDVAEWSERFGWRTFLRAVPYEQTTWYAEQYPKYMVSRTVYDRYHLEFPTAAVTEEAKEAPDREE
jgi:hypothetical protein